MRAPSDRTRNLVMAASLAGAVGLVAVRRLPALVLETASYSDGARVYDDVVAVRHAVWDAPQPLSEALDSPAREQRPALSPDGRWLAFSVGEPGLGCDLWLAEVLGGEPLEARPLTALNTAADELAPAFGEGALYFASDRAGGEGGYDLWVAPFADGVVGTAEPAPGGLNTAADELDPGFALAPDGERLLAFASNRARAGRGDLELYLAHLDRPRAAGDVELERLASLCSDGDDREPAFASGGRALYFASDRATPGRFGIYRTLREGPTWLAPRALEGLGAGSLRSPAPSADGFTLLYAVERPTGEESDLPQRDLVRARSIELLRRPPPELGWMDLLLVALLLTTALLAWLSRRWHELDVLYKCFLASVLAHLLLMWLFGGVHPEGRATPLEPGDGPTFRVRVLEDSSLAATTRERGGALQAAPASRAEEPLPSRREVAVATLAPARAPEVALARVQGDAGEAPRAAALALERAAPSDDPARSLALATPSERFERLQGQAPQVELSARSGAAQRSAASSPRLEAADLSALAGQVAQDASQPAPPSVTAPRAELGETRGFAAAVAERASPATPGDARVTLAAPAERFEPIAAASIAEPGLPTASAFAPSVDEGAAAPSARRSVVASPAADPASAQAPGPLALAPRPTDLPDVGPVVATPEVARAASVPGGELGPALELPVETFERIAREQPGPRAPSLPAASGFAPARQGLQLVPSPRRWEAPAVTSATSPEVPRPLEAIAPRPREEPHGLPEPPRRLDDTPYRARFGAEKTLALAEHGGGEDTERAVALGLAYLASIQNRDGSWGNPRLRDRKYRQVAIGKTGLALLAFLGAGHTQESGEHAAVTARAVDFLLASQREGSGHFGDGSAYSHGIATYALAECFALTRDERLREPLEAALGQILRNQVAHGDERLVGGWSYYYADGATYDRWPRVSITAWQVMALESARLGGLQVPDAAFDAARGFLLGSWDPRLEAFRYSHDPSRLRSGYATLPGSTPAALFALSLLGSDVAASPFEPARRFVLERAPSGYRYRGDDAFVSRAAGNLYFWYYGSLALFRVGGRPWERWNVALKETLLPAQARDGSWEPLDIYATSYARDDDDDKSYTTAMCVLSLEVYYRYFTPLLRVR